MGGRDSERGNGGGDGNKEDRLGERGNGQQERDRGRVGEEGGER